jgi:8-oxo-dGTP diphosphatase
MIIQQYVAGFLFDGENVVLVKKNRPKWQAGLLNGVGGHVEKFDVSNAEAMRREFREETGVNVGGWQEFATLSGKGFCVTFFYVNAPGLASQVASMTDEEIVVAPVAQIPTLNTIPNLKWLIPMAQSMQFERSQSFTVIEIPKPGEDKREEPAAEATVKEVNNGFKLLTFPNKKKDEPTDKTEQLIASGTPAPIALLRQVLDWGDGIDEILILFRPEDGCLRWLGNKPDCAGSMYFMEQAKRAMLDAEEFDDEAFVPPPKRGA